MYEDKMEVDAATAGAIVRQRVRYRLDILRQLQKHFEVDKCGAPQELSDHLHLSTKGLNLRRWLSALDGETNTSFTGEAVENARDWVSCILSWYLREDHAGQAHDKSCFKSAIEKEMQGRTQEWNDQERFFMAITDAKLESWENRLETAILVALQGDFANRLATVKTKASQHIERATQAKTISRKADDIRAKILGKIKAGRVDHFACAVPLSTIEDMREHPGPEATCPICHHSFTDIHAYSTDELLADFPVRIKYCGHIVGKSCLEQWMNTPKIDEAKYPWRSCPLCRVKIEAVPVPPVPAVIHDHVKTNLKAALNRRKLEDMSKCELEFEECLDAISACISEEIAARELMAVTSREENQLDTKVEAQRAYLQEKLEMLKIERLTWGFLNNTAWNKARDDWMTSGVAGRL
ncbi:Protein-serine/threonine phosphatase [Ascochyta lentis]